jgi:hypothetical protein
VIRRLRSDSAAAGCVFQMLVQAVERISGDFGALALVSASFARARYIIVAASIPFKRGARPT